MATKKVSDLQGIRGIAIIAVLGFHFYPNEVPNGYLGVDIFFVLSGFLMCVIFKNSENISTSSMIANFYLKRFRRILPLYQLIIFLSLLFLYFFFPETTYEANQNTAKRAMLFMSNNLKTTEQNYFETVLNSIDIFTHTWSLSVEMKFYVIVPFIFLLPYKLISFSIIALLSMFYYYSLPSNIAFFNVSARYWQFVSGMIAFILRNGNQKTHQPLDDVTCNSKVDQKTSSAVLTLIIFIVITMFFPLAISEQLLRPIITLFTALLLILRTGENKFLSNRVLKYIGDISYSLYLVHWSIYSYWKITQKDNTFTLGCFLATSILISIIIYHCFEKWYTSLSNFASLALIVFLLYTNSIILNYRSFDFQGSSSNSNRFWDMKKLEVAQRLNKKWSDLDIPNLGQKTCSPEPKSNIWCRQTGLNVSSKYKIMLIGNSWAANHGKIIYEECGKKANTMIQGSICSCEPLYPSTEWDGCDEFLTDVEKHVEAAKPDVVFHLTRYISYHLEPSDDFENDRIYQFMLNRMRMLIRHIRKKFYFLNAIPQVNINEVLRIVDNIKNNITFADVDKKMTNDTNYMVARKRYEQLVKDCGSKCELIDYHNLFYQNATKTFRFFNDFGHSYMTTGLHFSPPGLEFLRPVWRDVCDEL